MNRKSLTTTLGVLLALVVAGLATVGLWKLRNKNTSADPAHSARLPRDTAVIVQLDMAQVRRWGTSGSLRNWLQRGTEGPARDRARRYNEMVQGCGFDPWDKLDRATFALDRSMLQGTSSDARVLYLDGTFTQDQARACATWFVRQDSERNELRALTVGRHQVYFPSPPDLAPPERGPRFAFFGASALYADAPYMTRALQLYDGEQPGLEATAPVATQLARLSQGGMLYASMDVQAVRMQNPQDLDGFVEFLMQLSPGTPNLDLARRVNTAGASLGTSQGGTTLTLRAEMPDADAARTFSTALQALLNEKKPEARSALREFQGQLEMMQGLGALGRSLGAGAPDLSAQFRQVNQGLSTLSEMLDQITVRADGTSVIATLTANAQQVTTLESAARAGTDILERLPAQRGLPGRSPPLEDARPPEPPGPSGTPEPAPSAPTPGRGPGQAPRADAAVPR
ncbi:MAG: hypothetical protein HY909_30110 [Deltaproteobacteria bacterium]|nr:hypothetical protein [Deltaproteobacteria bacterium]